MAQSVNRVILVGNLGRDPEIRQTTRGSKIANLSVATSESWRDRSSGERREKTEWHRVVVFAEGLAGICEQYLRKGSKVYIEGQLETRKWTDNSGVEKYTTEVVMRNYGSKLVILDSRDGGGDSPYVSSSQGSEVGISAGGDQDFVSDPDDEIPF